MYGLSRSPAVQHRGDDLLGGVALGGDAREVTQVPLALLEGVARVRGADPLVARDHDVRIEGGDGVDASDPRLARGRVGEGGQHVYLVVDHVTGTTARSDGTCTIVECSMSP